MEDLIWDNTRKSLNKREAIVSSEYEDAWEYNIENNIDQGY